MDSTSVKIVAQKTGFAPRTLQKMCKSGKITATQDARKTWHIQTPIDTIAAFPHKKSGRKARTTV